MGQVIIQEETTKHPLKLIGYEAGVCWGAKDLSDEANIKRAKDCILKGHGRTMEFPQIYAVLDGYSARVIREYYTHIGGSPTRLQASTRYIDYKDLKYITPNSIQKDEKAKMMYDMVMNDISLAYEKLLSLNIPKEDIANILPLGMETKIVVRTNARNYVDMSRQRKCSRAYWEFRNLFNDFDKELSNYSEEWKWIIENCSKPKCMELGFCPEGKNCRNFKSE